MKISPTAMISALFFLASTSSGFIVGPPTRSRSCSRTQLTAVFDNDDTADKGDNLKGLAFSALFALSMVVSPLPSLADGKN